MKCHGENRQSYTDQKKTLPGYFIQIFWIKKQVRNPQYRTEFLKNDQCEQTP